MSVYPTPEQVVDVLTSIVGNDDDDEGTPEKEVAKALKKIPAITSPSGLVNRFLLLVDVVHQSLIPCLIATPYVYLSETDWSFHSHADFRAEKRKQLKELEEKIRSANTNELPELIDKFEGILADIFRIRIPAMPNYYITENYYDTVGASEIAEELIKTMTEARVFDAKTRLQNITKVLMRWFLLCPVGRPQIYVSDTEWTTSNEKDLRAEYREKLRTIV